MSDTKTYEISNLSGRTVIRCTDCGRWVDLSDGGVVRHSSRCDFSDDKTQHPAGQMRQPGEAKAVAKPNRLQAASRLLIREGTTAGFRSEDEIVDAVRAGYLSPGQAMNRDD